MRIAPQHGSVATIALLGSAIVAFLALVGISSLDQDPVADIHIEPSQTLVKVGETFQVQVVVESDVTVNVFSGELRFDPAILSVESIDYNTSIADLWAELPWFSNGEGTLNFGGGSTRTGGFMGKGTLLTVTFRSLRTGEGLISIHTPRILLHDGLGTDALLGRPTEAVFMVEPEEENLISKSISGTIYTVTEDSPSTDLNGDGKQSIADVSIFMLHIAGNDPRYDFNQDGEVDLRDLNILLSSK